MNVHLQELSYNKVRDISRVVKKDSACPCICPAAVAALVIIDKTCWQELKDSYGVDMIGPSRRLADVQHARNSQRDMLRAFPPAATYLELKHVSNSNPGQSTASIPGALRSKVPIRYVPVPMRRGMKDDAVVTRPSILKPSNP